MTATCSNCGAELPEELGQHAVAPVADVVQCPSCGASVSLERQQEAAGEGEFFSGEHSLEGVMEELEQKPGGPKADT